MDAAGRQLPRRPATGSFGATIPDISTISPLGAAASAECSRARGPTVDWAFRQNSGKKYYYNKITNDVMDAPNYRSHGAFAPAMSPKAREKRMWTLLLLL